MLQDESVRKADFCIYPFRVFQLGWRIKLSKNSLLGENHTHLYKFYTTQ